MKLQEIKVLLIKFMKFIIVLIIIDFGLGFVAEQIYFKQKTGKQARIIHSINNTFNDKIIIFGSSHANRHYIPSIFKKELGLSCYNAGVQGQKIIFHSLLEKIILEKASPKLIILNIDEDWLYKSDEAYDRLSDLFPFYWEYRDIMRPYLSLKSGFVDFKLFFKSYQFNSTIVHAIKYFLVPQKDFNGYRPLYGRMEEEYLKQEKKDDIDSKRSTPAKPLDKNFILAFKSFILFAKNKNIKLLFTTSPKLHPTNYSKNLSFTKMIDIAKAENVRFVNFNKDIDFFNRYDLFHDGSHLNDKGAQLFSRKVAMIIKNIKYERTTKNIVHLADSTKNEDDGNK